jgi:hypothetical protein
LGVCVSAFPPPEAQRPLSVTDWGTTHQAGRVEGQLTRITIQSPRHHGHLVGGASVLLSLGPLFLSPLVCGGSKP